MCCSRPVLSHFKFNLKLKINIFLDRDRIFVARHETCSNVRYNKIKVFEFNISFFTSPA